MIIKLAFVLIASIAATFLGVASNIYFPAISTDISSYQAYFGRCAH
jgi:hypothetical protein